MKQQQRTQETALARSSTVALEGPVNLSGEPLRSPASGTPCVHWRVRVHETVAPGMNLVHELSSPEALEISCDQPSGCGPRTVRVPLDEARIEAQPILHREGSPGALAVAERFGLVGAVRVEEVIVRPGERVQAEGTLLDPEALGGGPYRGAGGSAELLQATVRVGTGISLRPVLLPWALGTAAALLGTSAVAATIAKVCRAPAWQQAAPTSPAEIGAHKAVRPRWP